MTNDPDASRRWNGHHGPVLHSRDGFDVIDCAACGFRHVVPIPDEDALRDIYKHDYHVKDKPLMLQHQLEDREWLEATGDARLAVLERLLGRVGSLLDVVKQAPRRRQRNRGAHTAAQNRNRAQHPNHTEQSCASQSRNSGIFERKTARARTAR